MSQEPSYRLGIVAESPGDAARVTRLADRAICEAVEWVEPEMLEDLLRWQGLAEAEPYFELHAVHTELKRRNVRLQGHFSGEPGALDARMIRGLLVLFIRFAPEIAALVIARDTDGYTERREGFTQACATTERPFPAILALAHPEIEAWWLCGFHPEDQPELKRLQALRQELGFLPNEHPDRLTAGRQVHKRDTKRILDQLTGSDGEREERCVEAPLDRLRERGGACGLAAFLDAIRDDLAPILAGERRDA